MALVGIVIRTKDRPLFLQRALIDVQQQTYSDWSCIVVNDGGDDASVNATFEQSIEPEMRHKFQVLNNTNNLGMEAASNIGIKALKSEYYVIHDDDDTWGNDFLLEVMTYFSSLPKNTSIQGVVGETVRVKEKVVNNKIIEVGRVKHNPHINQITIPEVCFDNPFLPIAFVFTKYAYDMLGGFDETLRVAGDWDFNLRFIELFDIAVSTTALAFYHVRSKSENRQQNNTISDVVLHNAYRSIVMNKHCRRSAVLSRHFSITTQSPFRQVKRVVAYKVYAFLNKIRGR